MDESWCLLELTGEMRMNPDASWDWQERCGWVLMSAAVQMDFVLEACPKH